MDPVAGRSSALARLPARVATDVTTASTAVLARERNLPVHPVLAPLLASGLVRGQTVVCAGSASVSCALALLVAPTRQGSWAGVIGVPSLGVAAAADMGVDLDRTVFVRGRLDAHGDPANVLGALVDGVDLVVTSARFVSSLAPSLVRRFATRLQSRGAVCIVVDDTRAMSGDVRISTRARELTGIGDGHGHVSARRVTLEVDGRRHERSVRRDVWLPGPSGCPEEVRDIASPDVGLRVVS